MSYHTRHSLQHWRRYFYTYDDDDDEDDDDDDDDSSVQFNGHSLKCRFNSTSAYCKSAKRHKQNTKTVRIHKNATVKKQKTKTKTYVVGKSKIKEALSEKAC